MLCFDVRVLCCVIYSG